MKLGKGARLNAASPSSLKVEPREMPVPPADFEIYLSREQVGTLHGGPRPSNGADMTLTATAQRRYNQESGGKPLILLSSTLPAGRGAAHFGGVIYLEELLGWLAAEVIPGQQIPDQTLLFLAQSCLNELAGRATTNAEVRGQGPS